MRKIKLTLAATAFVLASVGLASAQTQGAGSLNTLRNATPLVKEAACHGWGPHCPPGRHWVCNGYGRCWCAPCW